MAYIVLLHVVLLGLIWKFDVFQRASSGDPDSPSVQRSQHYSTMVGYHMRADGNGPDDGTVFLGDSHIQGLCVACVADRPINLGIGGDTTVGLMERMGRYRALATAKAAVLQIGFNDLPLRGDGEIVASYSQLLKGFSAELPVVVSALLPIDEALVDIDRISVARIAALNQKIEPLCRARPGCVFVDMHADLVDASGRLKPGFHVGDGIHLSTDGYGLWIQALKAGLSTVVR